MIYWEDTNDIGPEYYEISYYDFFNITDSFQLKWYFDNYYLYLQFGSGYLDDVEIQVSQLTGVYVDIKPGEWPYDLNIKAKGKLTVAICGIEDFNVNNINPATIQITTNPSKNGVSPLSWSYNDIATPWTGIEGGGHDLGRDGFTDLCPKFSINDMVITLELDGYADGQIIPLYIIDNLYDGTPIVGHDYVVIKNK